MAILRKRLKIFLFYLLSPSVDILQKYKFSQAWGRVVVKALRY